MKPNTIILIVVALVVAGFAYWYFFTGTGNQPPVSATATANPAQIQFEALVGELQPISFNTAIFSDPRFNALVNISTAIAPESSGRLDPLAPFSGGGGLSSFTAAPASGTATNTPATGGH